MIYIYKPLLCNSKNLDKDYDYIRDDSKDNISHLNKYYAELTGQYWAWKNTDSDIIGFCHYRRYFTKDFLLMKLLNENEIKKDLEDFDIILPQIAHFDRNIIEILFNYNENKPMGAKSKELDKLRIILKEHYPEYLNTFNHIINGNDYYMCNMFITRKNIADDYFKWLFSILNKLEKEINFSEYKYGNLRVLGYMSELLLTVYVKKNNLKVKERYIFYSQARLPHLTYLSHRIPFINTCISALAKIINNF